MIDRRYLIAGLLGAAVMPRDALAVPAGMTVFKDPDCGCCGAWVDYLIRQGFTVETRLERNMTAVKRRFGVPAGLASCHTALIGGYVVEGHVPAEPIRRLLAERPGWIGIAVAGMPIGSPGMEVPGQSPEPFEVTAFGRVDDTARFANYPQGYRARP
jgi:hypothetical protein